jgi:hypothetical protein
MIGVATAIAQEVNQGKVSLLKWDRQEARYYPVNFNLRDAESSGPR